MNKIERILEDAKAAKATREYHQRTKRAQGAWNPTAGHKMPAKYLTRKNRNVLATILRGYRAGHLPLTTKGTASLSAVSMDAAASTAARNHLAKVRNDYERYEGRGTTNRIKKPSASPAPTSDTHSKVTKTKHGWFGKVKTK